MVSVVYKREEKEFWNLQTDYTDCPLHGFDENSDVSLY